jgi:hypothetical protein
MSEPTVRQLRAWQRRAETLMIKAAALMSDMIEVVGVEYEAAGENMTSQADEVMSAGQNLTGYLETCIAIGKATEPRKDRP